MSEIRKPKRYAETEYDMAHLLLPKAGGRTGPEKHEEITPGVHMFVDKNGSHRFVSAHPGLNGGKPVSAIQIMVAKGKKPLVTGAYTVPEFRRLGIARELLEDAKIEVGDDVDFHHDQSGLGKKWVQNIMSAGLKPGEADKNGDRYEPPTEPDLGEFIRNQFKDNYGESSPGHPITPSSGYILYDGTPVNMGDGRTRMEDHRAAIPSTVAMRDWGWPEHVITKTEQGGQYDSLLELIKRSGAIRVDAGKDRLHLHYLQAPSRAQREKVDEFVDQVRPSYVQISRAENQEPIELHSPHSSEVHDVMASGMRRMSRSGPVRRYAADQRSSRMMHGWIDPSGKEIPINGEHADWAEGYLRQYQPNWSKDEEHPVNRLLRQGWIRTSYMGPTPMFHLASLSNAVAKANLVDQLHKFDPKSIAYTEVDDDGGFNPKTAGETLRMLHEQEPSSGDWPSRRNLSRQPHRYAADPRTIEHMLSLAEQEPYNFEPMHHFAEYLEEEAGMQAHAHMIREHLRRVKNSFGSGAYSSGRSSGDTSISPDKFAVKAYLSPAGNKAVVELHRVFTSAPKHRNPGVWRSLQSHLWTGYPMPVEHAHALVKQLIAEGAEPHPSVEYAFGSSHEPVRPASPESDAEPHSLQRAPHRLAARTAPPARPVAPVRQARPASANGVGAAHRGTDAAAGDPRGNLRPVAGRGDDGGAHVNAELGMRNSESKPRQYAATGKHGTPDWNPEPMPGVDASKRDSDPLWAYHRGQDIDLGSGNFRGSSMLPDAYHAILPIQRHSYTNAAVLPAPEGMENTSPVFSFHKSSTPHNFSFEKHPENMGAAEHLADFPPAYGDESTPLTIAMPRSSAINTRTDLGRNAFSSLSGLSTYAKKGDPYRIFAASVLGGNRHAIPLLVHMLKRRDNPAGWWKGWVDLHRRMENEQGDLQPHQVAERLKKIAAATEPESGNPSDHRAIAEGAHGAANGMGSGPIPDSAKIRPEQANPRDFSPYLALADHMAENGLEPYADLIRSELMNVMPELRTKPKGRRRFERSEVRGQKSEGRSQKSEGGPRRYALDHRLIESMLTHAETDPQAHLALAEHFGDEGYQATAELMRMRHEFMPGWHNEKHEMVLRAVPFGKPGSHWVEIVSHGPRGAHWFGGEVKDKNKAESLIRGAIKDRIARPDDTIEQFFPQVSSEDAAPVRERRRYALDRDTMESMQNSHLKDHSEDPLLALGEHLAEEGYTATGAALHHGVAYPKLSRQELEVHPFFAPDPWDINSYAGIGEEFKTSPHKSKIPLQIYIRHYPKHGVFNVVLGGGRYDRPILAHYTTRDAEHIRKLMDENKDAAVGESYGPIQLGRPTGRIRYSAEQQTLNSTIKAKFEPKYGPASPHDEITGETGFILHDGTPVRIGKQNQRMETHREALPDQLTMQKLGWPAEAVQSPRLGLNELLRRSGAVRVLAGGPELVVHHLAPLTSAQKSKLMDYYIKNRPQSILHSHGEPYEQYLHNADPREFERELGRPVRMQRRYAADPHLDRLTAAVWHARNGGPAQHLAGLDPWHATHLNMAAGLLAGTRPQAVLSKAWLATPLGMHAHRAILRSGGTYAENKDERLVTARRPEIRDQRSEVRGQRSEISRKMQGGKPLKYAKPLRTQQIADVFKFSPEERTRTIPERVHYEGHNLISGRTHHPLQEWMGFVPDNMGSEEALFYRQNRRKTLLTPLGLELQHLRDGDHQLGHNVRGVADHILRNGLKGVAAFGVLQDALQEAGHKGASAVHDQDWSDVGRALWAEDRVRHVGRIYGMDPGSLALSGMNDSDVYHSMIDALSGVPFKKTIDGRDQGRVLVGGHKTSFAPPPMSRAYPFVKEDAGILGEELRHVTNHVEGFHDPMEREKHVNAIKRHYRSDEASETPEQKQRRYAAAPAQQSLAGSTATVASKNQDVKSIVAKDIYSTLQLLPTYSADAIHQSPHGSRPAITLRSDDQGNAEKATYAAAWLGMMTRQPGQVVFHIGEGKDLLHRFQSDKPIDHLDRLLKRIGILDRTVLPGKGFNQFVIYDKGAQKGAALRALVGSLGSKLDTSRGTGNFIGSMSDEGEAREAYRRIIRTYESKVAAAEQQAQKQAPPAQAPQTQPQTPQQPPEQPVQNSRWTNRIAEAAECGRWQRMLDACRPVRMERREPPASPPTANYQLPTAPQPIPIEIKVQPADMKEVIESIRHQQQATVQAIEQQQTLTATAINEMRKEVADAVASQPTPQVHVPAPIVQVPQLEKGLAPIKRILYDRHNRPCKIIETDMATGRQTTKVIRYDNQNRVAEISEEPQA